MGRDRTWKATHEESKRLTTRYFTERGVLKPNLIAKGPMTWHRGEEETGSIWVEINTLEKQLTLGYLWGKSQEEVKQVIPLGTRPSNLGKGNVWYFIDPYYGNRCRVMYMLYGSKYFRSRLYYENRGLPIYYWSQTSSKYDRWNERYWKYDKAIHKLKGPGYTPYYDGKPTRAQRRLKRLQELKWAADEERWRIGNIPIKMAAVLHKV